MFRNPKTKKMIAIVMVAAMVLALIPSLLSVIDLF